MCRPKEGALKKSFDHGIGSRVYATWSRIDSGKDVSISGRVDYRDDSLVKSSVEPSVSSVSHPICSPDPEAIHIDMQTCASSQTRDRSVPMQESNEGWSAINGESENFEATHLYSPLN